MAEITSRLKQAVCSRLPNRPNDDKSPIVGSSNKSAPSLQQANPSDEGNINIIQPDLKKESVDSDRAQWSSKIEFLLSAIGFAVGLGNVWRFPYLCFRNGGGLSPKIGAFLIPYTIFLLIAGLPLFFLELLMGQYSACGCISLFRRISPLFKGIGYAMITLSSIVSVYYNVLIGYTLFYLFASFTTGPLPWSFCNPSWASKACRNWSSVANQSGQDFSCLSREQRNASHQWACVDGSAIKIKSSAEDYWEQFVLGLTPDISISNLGSPRWHVTLCNLLAFIVVFLCLIKGVKSSGKVVYFTATFPYVMLTVLLIRGVTLPGASAGLDFYLRPNMSHLRDARVWGDAAIQIFYSLGPGWGGLLTMSSYNNFHSNCHRDAIMVALINCGTSLYAGFAIFSVLGFMATQLHMPIRSVIKDGPGLAFIVYPEGLTRLPGGPFWSICFFFMLFTLGLDSQFVSIEVTVSALTDEFPKYLGRHKIWVTGILCAVLFLVGISCTCQGGIYVLTLIDYYGGGIQLLVVASLEILVFIYIYGWRRLSEDIKCMLGGFPLRYYWLSCWRFLTPLAMMFIIIFNIIEHKPVHYGTYLYPGYAIAIGWTIGTIALYTVPFFILWQLWSFNDRSFQKIKSLLTNGDKFKEALRNATQPTSDWVPAIAPYERQLESPAQNSSTGSTCSGNSDVVGEAFYKPYYGTVTLNMETHI